MAVVDWLLDSDPSISWQVMRDLTHEQTDVIAAERSRVATEGWGARLLALQAPDGQWGGRPWSDDWTDTFHALELLRQLGLDPESDQARRAAGLVRERVTWKGGAPVDTPWDDNRFFDGEVEPCINGNVVATGSYFGQDVEGLVDRLLREQLPDGGWNCEVENGATVSSFGTTINVLEGLLEHEQAAGRSRTCTKARSTSKWRTARASPAAATRSARCESWTGRAEGAERVQPRVGIANLKVESRDGTFTIGREAFPHFSWLSRLGVHIQSDQVRVASRDPAYVETALTVLDQACLQLGVPEAEIAFVDTVIPPPTSGLRYGFKGAFTTDRPNVIWVFAN